MKLTYERLQRLIESLLTETKCPACGNANAYVGMRNVECPNPSCTFFSQKQADDTTPKRHPHPWDNYSAEEYAAATERMLATSGHGALDTGEHSDEECPDCGGEGSEPCATCGYQPETEVMTIHIPGNIAVSHDYFENDREELETTYNVSIDTGPGGVVEVCGEPSDVTSFIDDHGLTPDQYEEVEDEELCHECGENTLDDHLDSCSYNPNNANPGHKRSLP